MRTAAVLLGLMVIGCAQKPVKKPMEEHPVVQEEKEPGIKAETAKPEEKPTLVEVLTAQADLFSSQGNFMDALLVYNQALAQSQDKEWDTILSKIEITLARADSALIQKVLSIENLTIPEPLLLYWLGLNLLSEGNKPGAKEALTQFVGHYPDHPYALDAIDLIDGITQSEIKKDTLGCLLPLSGKYGVFGQRALKGIELAIQDLSRTHGRNFNVIIKDTGSDPQKAVTGLEELVKDKVIGILGPLLAVEEAGARAQELGIPMIALTQKQDFPLQGDYLFSNFITPEIQVQALGTYAFRDLGIEKVAILYPDERYGKKYMELFWDMADEFGVDVVGVEAYQGNETDFTLPIQKLTGEVYPLPDELKERFAAENREMGPEGEVLPLENFDSLETDSRNSLTKSEDKIEIDFQAVFIPDSASRLNLLLPQLAFYDAKGIVLLGTNLWHDKSLLKGSKGYNRNAVITDGYFGDSNRPETARFEKEFSDLYQTRPGFLEAVSYDTMKILFETSLDEAVNTRKALRDALLTARIFEGVTGNTIFDQSGAARKELFLITIKRGRFMEIDKQGIPNN
ncbi:penicillin-binding protein activator [Desulfospira joergensenii]|uniref:penicillin-binding protein activator n=1 Tax=Desulfospira joergensenii TaxID=53329 RepID=UPI0003B73769|nr:penicillin-binding protein activator [Desulfospira joergensenii]